MSNAALEAGRRGRPAGGVTRSRRTLVALGMLALASCDGSDKSAADDRLARRSIDPKAVTVSGISSGGYMAVQFQVAHSNLVQGAGVVAAGPYLCAEGTMRHALGRCLKGDEEIPPTALIETTSQLALAGTIDPIAGLAQDRVWVFHGAADPFIGTGVVDALVTYYEALVEPANIVRIEHPEAGHTFPTRDASAPACAVSESPYLANCGLDGAHSLLAQLYGDLAPSRPARASSLVEFDQRPYAAAAGSAAFDDRGWLYVPEACAAGAKPACRLHVVFHGCRQGASFVGDAFVRRSGYLDAAEANRIVLLFPQLEPSFQPLNPQGCWDWWGYEGQAYATQRSPQVRAVRVMIADLIGEANEP
jgi:poly(3-hydroxybutyrate) depolymerase